MAARIIKETATQYKCFYTRNVEGKTMAMVDSNQVSIVTYIYYYLDKIYWAINLKLFRISNKHTDINPEGIK
jgi:hypothetical protein